MENQNRNNRVYTGQQSGKTDRSIGKFIEKRKRKTAVSTADLVRLSGCKDARTLRERYSRRETLWGYYMQRSGCRVLAAKR